MIHILHGFSNVDSEFKPRNLRQEVHYIESPRTKKRIRGLDDRLFSSSILFPEGRNSVLLV